MAEWLLRLLRTDASHGLRMCSSLWIHLAAIEETNPNQFIDPFYVSWYYCKKKKYRTTSRQNLDVEITAFVYGQWTSLVEKYLLRCG